METEDAREKTVGKRMGERKRRRRDGATVAPAGGAGGKGGRERTIPCGVAWEKRKIEEERER